MKPVFGYIRVSTTKQLNGDGPERQRAAIEIFCASKGFFVQRWFTDDASGTVSAESREQYCEMLSVMGPRARR